MSRLNHPFKNITPSDIINLVNDELSRLNASHNLGASMFSSLNFGINHVVCSSKKFKSSVKLYINKSFGDFRGFVIHSQTKEGNLAACSGMDCWRALNDGNSRPIPRQKTAAEIEQARLDAELAESQKLAAEMARKGRAASIYARSSETGENAYLARKNVIAHKNVRFDSNKLIIPLYQFNAENSLEIFAVQKIDLGKKETNGLQKNSFFPIGNLETPKNIYFAEGYATASSVYESLSCKNDSLVIMSVDSGNMLHVVDTFAEKFADVYNSYGFTICADNDLWKSDPAHRFTGFKTAHAIAQKHPNVLISYPFFRHEHVGFYEKYCRTIAPTDFNDLARWDVGNHDAEQVKFSPSEFFSQIYDFATNSLCDFDKQQNLRELKLGGFKSDLRFFEKPPVELSDKKQVDKFIQQNPNNLTPSLHSDGVDYWYKVNKPFLDNSDLSNLINALQDNRPIAVFVVSGTGSNKTGSAVKLSFDQKDLTTIAVSHRIALESDMNQRFNTTEDGEKVINFQSYEYAGYESDRVTTVVNSIARFAPKQMVIVDESTQVDRHLARIEARDKPLKIEQAYEKQIKGAQIIVRMDAHFTDADLLRERQQLPPNAKVIVLVNEYQKNHVLVDGVARRRTIRLHPFAAANQKASGRGHVLNLLDNWLETEQRAVFYTNSKDSSKRDLDQIAARHGLKTLQEVASEHGMSATDYVRAHGLRDVQYVFVTQDNAGDFAPILRDGGNWAEKLKDVRLFACTPIIGSGVDFSKAGFYKAFGIFGSNTTTSREITQQVNRFRDVYDLDLAVETKNYQLEENPEEIARKSGYLAKLTHDEVTRLAIKLQFAGVNETPYTLSKIEINHAEIEAADNRDKNNLLKSLQFWLNHEGFAVEVTEEKAEFDGRADAKARAESRRVQAILSAPIIENEQEYERLSKKSCTESQTYSKERYKIERFYDAPISEELIEFDDHGKKRGEIKNNRLMVTPIESVQESTIKEYLAIQDVGLKNLQLLTKKRAIFDAIYRTARLFSFSNVIYSLENQNDFELLLQAVVNFRATQIAELEKIVRLKKGQIEGALKVLENPEISRNEISVLIEGLLNGKVATHKKMSKIKDILLSLKGFSIYGVLWKICRMVGAPDAGAKHAEKLLEAGNILKAVELLSNGIKPRQKSEILAELRTCFINEDLVTVANSLNVLRDGLPKFDPTFLDDCKKLWLYYKNMLNLHGLSLINRHCRLENREQKIYIVNLESILPNRPFLLKKSE